MKFGPPPNIDAGVEGQGFFQSLLRELVVLTSQQILNIQINGPAPGGAFGDLNLLIKLHDLDVLYSQEEREGGSKV